MTATAHGRPLTTVEGFIGRLSRLPVDADHHYFFRGHSDGPKYRLQPSAYRTTGGLSSEHTLFRELISTNPSEFKDDTSTLERLARMQHHGGPTRLLDISSNPLVALYFACNGSSSAQGEVVALRVRRDIIKFFDSDTVSCIANLARLARPEKELLPTLSSTDFSASVEAKKLLHFIKEEKPYFEPHIVQADLSRVVVVRPKLNTKRILAQAGAFLLFGQVQEMDGKVIDGISIDRIRISPKSKSGIMSTLDMLSINEGALFLDVDSYAKYLKRQYGA